MVKLGDAFIELSAVEAITPIRDSRGYAVFLTGGRIMNLSEVTENEVMRVLSDSSYLELTIPVTLPVVAELTVPERAELSNVYIRGFRYAARDQGGAVFVYTKCPTKGEKSWINDDDESEVWRLRNSYDCLSFMDAAPLDLAGLFAED